MNELPETTTNGLPPRLPIVRGMGCLAEDCDGKHYCRGLCRPHYRAAYYAANAERSKALTRRYRAQKKTEPGVSQHPVDVTDVEGASGGVVRVSSFGSDDRTVPQPPRRPGERLPCNPRGLQSQIGARSETPSGANHHRTQSLGPLRALWGIPPAPFCMGLSRVRHQPGRPTGNLTG
jgi:hypothetical protein